MVIKIIRIQCFRYIQFQIQPRLVKINKYKLQYFLELMELKNSLSKVIMIRNITMEPFNQIIVEKDIFDFSDLKKIND